MLYTIKRATNISELDSVAACRIKAFPGSFSSALGVRYVKKLLSYYLSNNNFLFYVEESGICIGFVSGMVPESEFLCSTREAIDVTFSDILKSIFRKPWLIFHPVLINNLKLILEYFYKKTGLIEGVDKKKFHINVAPEILNSVGLIDIAVLPEWQNKGIGGNLLKTFENYCSDIGKNRMHLSVKPRNIQAVNAYLKNGWKILEKNEKQLIFYKNDF